MVVSPHDPAAYYQAGNVLFRPGDRGQSWDVISPDLTFDDPEKQVPSGPITNEAAGGEIYNVIMYVAESPHEAGVLFVDVNGSLIRIRSARRQIEGVLERMAGADADTVASVSDSGEELIQKIDEWEGVITQTRQETFQEVVNFSNKFNAQIIGLLQFVDGTEPPVTAGARTRLVDLQAQWEQHRDSLETLLGADLDAFNEAVRATGVPAVIIRR